MNEDLMEIFHRHYQSELEDYNRRLSAHEVALSFEEFKSKCETDADFKKKNIYLFHPSYIKDDEKFLRMIDFLGGWPVNAKSVVLQHQTNRACYFSADKDVRNGWNTSIVTADEYYWWKLSDTKKDRFRKEIYGSIGQDFLSRSYKSK